MRSLIESIFAALFSGNNDAAFMEKLFVVVCITTILISIVMLLMGFIIAT